MASPQFENPDFRLRQASNGDVLIVKDAEVLKQRFINALLTVPGERPMRPEFGSRFREVIFQLNDREQNEFARSEARKVAKQVDAVNFESLTAEKIDKHTKEYTITISSPFLSDEQQVTIRENQGQLSTTT